MEKEKTLYEKAIEKEKEVDVIIQIIENGSHDMYQLAHESKYQLDIIFGKAFPYINRAIRRELEPQIIATAKQLASDELKEARQLASNEARKILADCDDEIKEEIEEEKVNDRSQTENTYTVLRCKECGADMSKRKYSHDENRDAGFWECSKCGKDYYNLDEISFTIVETLYRREK